MTRLLCLLLALVAAPALADTSSKAPTSDYSESGTWSGASAGTRYTLLDDYPDSSSDYLIHGTGAGDLLLGFSAFSIPSGSTINSVKVEYYDKGTTSGTQSCRGSLRVNGTVYNASGHDPSDFIATSETDTWSTNPATSSAWTVNDVNGSGSYPLQHFGVGCSDANPTVRFYSAQITVDYTPSGTTTTTAATTTTTTATTTTTTTLRRRVLVAE